MLPRDKTIVFLDRNGWKLSDIGRKFNLSRPRVYQIVNLYNRKNPRGEEDCEACGEDSRVHSYEVGDSQLFLCGECFLRLHFL